MTFAGYIAKTIGLLIAPVYCYLSMPSILRFTAIAFASTPLT